MSFAKRPNTLFNAFAVAKHLSALKAAAEVAEAGEEIKNDKWWAPAVSIAWPKGGEAKKADKGKGKGSDNQWLPINYTDANGVSGRLNLRVIDERHTGLIMASTDAGIAAQQAAHGDRRTYAKRDGKPSFQVQKWKVQVKTDESGITPLTDEEGQPILPGDEHLSDYYAVAKLLDEIFVEEAQRLLDRGAAFVSAVSDVRKANKKAGLAEILEAFRKAHGPSTEMIVTPAGVNTIRGLCRDAPTLPPQLLALGILVPNPNVVRLVQENISDRAKKNAGAPLPNPMTRIVLDFNRDTGEAITTFFDKKKEFFANGKKGYEHATVDGVPVNNGNIHDFIKSGSVGDGILCMDAVCISAMGLSVPVKAKILVVAAPESRGGGMGLEDIYGDSVAAAPAPAPAPAPARPAAAAAPGRPAAPPNDGDGVDDDFADLLSQ